MNDLVLPLGTGSKHDNFELRYSLRSLQQHGVNYGRLAVIGVRPEWLQPDLHIPCLDRHNHERNIYEKLMIACRCNDVSSTFTFWMDDIFLTASTDLTSYPATHDGTLEQQVERRHKYDGYRLSLVNSLDACLKNKIPTLHYDLHRPFVYHKETFVDAMGIVDWNRPNGYVIQSLYGNACALPSAQMTDLKFNAPMSFDNIHEQVQGRHVFSVGDWAMTPVMKQFISELYTEKSKWEI
jgi:hypothetical protein